MRVYLASSWRNPHIDGVFEQLRAAGHDVYDFRSASFRWRDVAADLGLTVALDDADNITEKVRADDLRRFLAEPRAVDHLELDMTALDEADAVVLVLPCNRSAHTELGYAIARGMRTIVLLTQPEEPELLYGLVDLITDDVDEVLAALADPACRECGCTDVRACPDGCSWVHDPEQLGDLCSACLPTVEARMASSGA